MPLLPYDYLRLVNCPEVVTISDILYWFFLFNPFSLSFSHSSRAAYIHTTPPLCPRIAYKVCQWHWHFDSAFSSHFAWYSRRLATFCYIERFHNLLGVYQSYYRQMNNVTIWEKSSHKPPTGVGWISIHPQLLYAHNPSPPLPQQIQPLHCQCRASRSRGNT